ncbi:RNA-directed DNA polymerase, eukaryota [Tanacetum coccineum]|uniref:RNA-directed DNA polymerase, eukaryota n=1 Tax=Tanacetum coccineum TaxID=301880 RepID=A0ABQ5BHU1_9ASTR
MAIRGVLAEGEWMVEPAMFPKCLSLDCGTNKSLGPDGFSFEFFRRYWSIIDQDVVVAVLLFFSTCSFPPGCNSLFIALIPKTQEAKLVKDFQHISLIRTFVSNRQILDGPFILNELFSWCKRKNTKAMIFKVDFEKAFDLVRWDFLDEVLHKFRFGDKWRGWIQGCLSSSMGSILVNDSPTSEFQFHKGLKQGDPLSPFLFILIMESLHVLFENVLTAGLYKGIHLDDSLSLSHLFYADDVVFVGKWDKLKFSTIVNVLKWFFMASGLKINIHKSKLMAFGILIPKELGGNMSRLISWDEVIAKISSRLSKWKLKTLSIGGRYTLTKPVLSSLPLHYFSIFKVPKASKKMRLGISSLFALNRAILFKWICHFITNGSSLWSRVIKAFYGNRGANDNIHNSSKTFSGLISIRELLVEGWQKNPNQTGKPEPKIIGLGLGMLIRRPPRGGVEEDQLRLLGDIISSILPTILNLSIRGLDIPSILCPNCYIVVESTAHILFSCDMARQLMRKVARWWEVEIHDIHSYGDWLLWFNNLRFPKRLKDVFEGVCYVMCRPTNVLLQHHVHGISDYGNVNFELLVVAKIGDTDKLLSKANTHLYHRIRMHHMCS